MRPQMKLFLSSEKAAGAFGTGKFLLLRAIRREGSLKKAASSLGRSYRKAWGDIKRAEEGMGRKLVIRVRGGKNGGKTVLTEFGLELLKEWQNYEKDLSKALKKAYNKHLRKVIGEAT